MTKRVVPAPRDARSLAQVVPGLAPEALHQLILDRGLEASGEVFALATPAQLTALCDLDLWRSAQPGSDESFNAERFGEWLELLAEADSTVAARIVAAMDQPLIVAGLSRYIRVLDPVTLVTIVDGEPLEIDVPMHRGYELEVSGYLVRGIRTDAWDAVIALLVALETDHPDRFHAVMRACRQLSNSAPEVDGLDDLLLEPAQLLHELAVAREDRRSELGYSTPANARAFLRTARQRPRPVKAAPSTTPQVSTLVPPGSRLLLVQALIEHVRESDHAAYDARSHELAFLANTLLAGCSIQSRAFTPQEATEAAISICNLGLEHWPGLSDTFLLHHDLVSVFEVGWTVLHEDVSMFTAQQLIVALSSVHCSDAAIQKDVKALRIALTKLRKAGTPWLVRDGLDAIAMLDMPAWISVAGLLDECPVIPAALTATLESRTGAVSATEFEFISTRSQIAKVHEFMARFLDILQR